MFLLVLLLCEGTYSTDELIPIGDKNISVFNGRGQNDRLDNNAFIVNNMNENTPGSWPWAVSIGYHDHRVSPAQWMHACDGTIATKNTVITSQSCLDEYEYEAGNDVDKLSVRAGDNHLKFNKERDVQEVKVKRQVKHPSFDVDAYPPQHNYDISVLFLSSQFDFSTNVVKPVSLPTEPTLKEADTDIAVSVSGWGGRASGTGRKLEDSVITTINDIYCSRVYKGEGLQKNLTDDTMCALSVLDLSGTCKAGGGSGIYRLDHSLNRFIMTGVLSSTNEFFFCGSPNAPNVFVRIASKSIITFLYKTIFDVDIDVFGWTPSLNSSRELSPKLDPYYETCGTNSMINTILGKSSRKGGKWPWLVPLFADNLLPDHFVFFCAATILSRSKLLTAAHCFDTFGDNQQIKARAGDVFLDNVKDDRFVQKINVSMSDITIHPKYKRNRYYDLAIIDLQTELYFSKKIKPICLLSLSEVDQITKINEISLTLSVVGWGKDNSGIAGTSRKETIASIFSKEICDKTHEDVKNKKNLVPDLFTEDVLCAGDPAGVSGTCSGDSGGGAVHFDQEKLRFVLRGVVSGSKFGQCGTGYVPNIYARIANSEISKWIFTNINFMAPISVEFDNKNIMFEAGQEVNYVYTVEANPPAQIFWTLTDDANNSMSFEEVQSHQNHSNLWITKSTVTFMFPPVGDSVTLQCVAKNLVGHLSATATLKQGLPCLEGSNFNTPCICGSGAETVFCRSDHILCAKSPYECLTRSDLGTKLTYMEETINQKEETIQSQEQTINEKEETIQSQEQTINQKEETIQSQEQIIEEKDKIITQLMKSNKELEEAGKSCTTTPTSITTSIPTTTMPTPATRNVIFITGGANDVYTTEVLDPSGSCSRFTSRLPDTRSDHTMSWMEGDLVLCGGGHYGRGTETSCISTRSPDGPWVHHSNLTTIRLAHVSAATWDTIHVFGGSSYGGSTAETLEDLNGNRRWKKHQLPISIGYGPCAVEINNTVYITGGIQAKTRTLKWNTDQQWTRLADMDPPGRYYHGCGVVNHSLILVAGGYDRSHRRILRLSAIYDIKKNTWRPTGQLNQARSKGVMVNVGEDVYFLGGVMIPGGLDLNTVEKYSAATNEWINTNLTMNTHRNAFSALSVDRADFC